MVCVTSGANMNFDRLRLVSELAEIGARREAMLATTIPEVRSCTASLFCLLHPPVWIRSHSKLMETSRGVADVWARCGQERGSFLKFINAALADERTDTITEFKYRYSHRSTPPPTSNNPLLVAALPNCLVLLTILQLSTKRLAYKIVSESHGCAHAITHTCTSLNVAAQQECATESDGL